MGMGIAVEPSTTTVPPVSRQITAPSQHDRVNAALDRWQIATSKYAEAKRNFEEAERNALDRARNCPLDQPTKDELDRLRAVQDAAKEGVSKAYNVFAETVCRTIINSCSSAGKKCNFASMRVAAERLDAAVRADGAQKDDAAGRQLATRRAIHAVLLDAARSSLQLAADRRTATRDRNQTITDVASWVVDQQDSPRFSNNFSRLWPLVGHLVKSGAANIANDLVAACEAQGMAFTTGQKTEIAKLGLTVSN